MTSSPVPSIVIHMTMVLLLTIGITEDIFGQDFSIQPYDITISENDKILSWGHLGGLTAPIISQVDLNQDGILDLYIYDIDGHVQLPLVNSGEGMYNLDYEMAKNIPYAEYWSRMIDFTGDGIPDLLTSSLLPFLDEVRAYIGQWNGSELTFQPYINPFNEPFLTFESGNTHKAILVNYQDMPGFYDIDFDGDLDIITFDNIGAHAVWYKNISVDSGYALSRPCFVLEDDCWGKFYEDGSGRGFALSASPGQCADGWSSSGPETVHNGATITLMDIGNDLDVDAIVGDAASLYASLLVNQKTSGIDFMQQEVSQFPNERQALPTRYLPLCQLIDLDDDLINEVLLSPFQTGGKDVEMIQSFRLNDIGEYQRTPCFINDNIWDHGSLSHLSSLDYNGNGLEDLVVSIGRKFNPSAKDVSFLILLERTDEEALSFKVVDTNWLNLPSFDINDIAFTPQFHDMDADGDIDVIMGSASGKMYYLQNHSGHSTGFQFQDVIKGYMGIDVDYLNGNYSCPTVKDIDGDGLPDLLIGVFNGSVTYFKNIGSQHVARFDADPDAIVNRRNYLDINVSAPGATDGNAAISILDLNTKALLGLGDNEGYIGIYNDGDMIFKQHLGIGERIKPVFLPSDNEDQIFLLCGNKRGGISSFKLDIKNLSDNENTNDLQLQVTNPVESICFLKETLEGHLTIVDINGRTVLSDPKYRSNRIDMSGLITGTYVMRISLVTGETVYTKLIKK